MIVENSYSTERVVMYKNKCNTLRSISAVGVGTLIAFYCSTRVLIILLALTIVLLGLAIPRN